MGLKQLPDFCHECPGTSSPRGRRTALGPCNCTEQLSDFFDQLDAACLSQLLGKVQLVVVDMFTMPLQAGNDDRNMAGLNGMHHRSSTAMQDKDTGVANLGSVACGF